MFTGVHNRALHKAARIRALGLAAALAHTGAGLWPAGQVAAQASSPTPAEPMTEQQQEEQSAVLAEPMTEQQQEEQSAVLAMDEEARQHFQLGRTFYDSGRFQQAVEEFQAAYKLSGRPQLLYNVYVAERDAGQLQNAVDALRGYLEKVPDAPDRVNLKARLESLEAQARRQTEQEALTKQVAEKPAAQTPATRTEIKHSVVPWVLTGTGAALLVGSVATGVMAKGKANDLDDTCGGTTCPSSEQSNVDSTRTLAITTDVLWSVGAAAAITGVVLWLTGALDEERQVVEARPRARDRRAVAFDVAPSLVGNGVCTTFSGRF